jgi:acetyltransferase EpsM
VKDKSLDVLVWGASGHGRVVVDILRLRGHRLAGFIDGDENKPGRTFLGAPIHGPDELARLHQRGLKHMIIAVGDCRVRLQLADFAATRGFSFVTAIHPSAVVAADAAVGEGTVVAAAAVINPAAIIGRHCIINTRASVDHECRLADGVHICPGVSLAGDVAIGRGAWVGIGSSVIQKVTIGSGAVIGAGAVVISDIPDEVTAYGVPARVVTPTRA